MTPAELAEIDQLLAKMNGKVDTLVSMYRSIKAQAGDEKALQEVGHVLGCPGNFDHIELATYVSLAVARLADDSRVVRQTARDLPGDSALRLLNAIPWTRWERLRSWFTTYFTK